jgi:hypothetical protein
MTAATATEEIEASNHRGTDCAYGRFLAVASAADPIDLLFAGPADFIKAAAALSEPFAQSRCTRPAVQWRGLTAASLRLRFS